LLLQKLDAIVARQFRTVKLAVPSKAEALKDIMQNSLVKSQEWGHGVVNLEAEVPVKLLSRIEKYVL
jgi:50S ribosomal subunit-associated GTPase HflX